MEHFRLDLINQMFNPPHHRIPRNCMSRLQTFSGYIDDYMGTWSVINRTLEGSTYSFFLPPMFGDIRACQNQNFYCTNRFASNEYGWIILTDRLEPISIFYPFR